MFRRLIVLTAALLAVGVMASAAAAEGGSDRFVYDCGPLTGVGCSTAPGFRDMVGPDAGWVTNSQRQSGDMQLRIELRGVDASTTYTIWFQCGPTHYNPGGQQPVSTVTTDANGRANYSFTVSAATIANCGAASGTGHLDLESGFSTSPPAESSGLAHNVIDVDDGPRSAAGAVVAARRSFKR